MNRKYFQYPKFTEDETSFADIDLALGNVFRESVDEQILKEIIENVVRDDDSE